MFNDETNTLNNNKWIYSIVIGIVYGIFTSPLFYFPSKKIITFLGGYYPYDYNNFNFGLWLLNIFIFVFIIRILLW